MQIRSVHPWDISCRDAIKLQNDLKSMVIEDSDFSLDNVRIIAGVDVGYSRKGRKGIGVVVLLEWPTLHPIEVQKIIKDIEFPYIPGLLSFREGPVVVALFKRVNRIPDIVIFDGQGIAHPRRLGIASHLGLWLDLPTIGCAKSRLVGRYREPGVKRGCCTSLIYEGRKVGAVLRTRTSVKPVFVSIGHKIDLESAVKIVLQSSIYRIPEPVRIAHTITRTILTG